MNDPATGGSRPERLDVMICVEDPGAANLVAKLPGALSGQGVSARLFACGAAVSYFLDRGIEFQEAPCGTDAGSLLNRFAPRMLAVGTSENAQSISLELVKAARSVGIVSVGLVDMAVNSDMRFRGRSESPLTYAPDWLLVADASTRDAYARLGYPEEKIIITGHPHYDDVREFARRFASKDREELKRTIFPGAPDGHPVIVFVSEGHDLLNPAASRRTHEYTLSGRGNSHFRTAIVLEEFLDAVHECRLRPYVVLRLHPKNSKDEFAEYLPEIGLVSMGGDPLELLWVSDLVVGMSSMLLVEAFILGRPVVSILPRAIEKEWLPVTEGGQIPVLHTRKALREFISRFMEGADFAGGHDRALLGRGALTKVCDFIVSHLR